MREHCWDERCGRVRRKGGRVEKETDSGRLPGWPSGWEGVAALCGLGVRSCTTLLASQLVLGGRLAQEGCDLPQATLCFSAKAIPEESGQPRSVFARHCQQQSRRLGILSFIPEAGSGQHMTVSSTGKTRIL